MGNRLPSILVSGASGIVGRQFLQSAREEFSIFALSRRSRQEAGVAGHENLHWRQVDLADPSALDRTLGKEFVAGGGVDYVLHLAGYYDFEKKHHQEYRRTNILGTRNLLEKCGKMKIKRFVYVSSVLASEFPPAGRIVDEKTPPDASHPYGRSKAAGERMVAGFSRRIPCSIVRCGAVFTDWCEFPPLYTLLEGWLSEGWHARLICGRGDTALPFIHCGELVRLFLEIFRQSHRLPVHGIYLAAPGGAVSHRELYQASTDYYFGRSSPPRHIPKKIVSLGLLCRDLVGRLKGRRPFERMWMAGFVDRRLEADSRHTQETLSWHPAARYHLLEQLPVLIENRRRLPGKWLERNLAAMKRGEPDPLSIGLEIRDRRVG